MKLTKAKLNELIMETLYEAFTRQQVAVKRQINNLRKARKISQAVWTAARRAVYKDKQGKTALAVLAKAQQTKQAPKKVQKTPVAQQTQPAVAKQPVAPQTKKAPAALKRAVDDSGKQFKQFRHAAAKQPVQAKQPAGPAAAKAPAAVKQTIDKPGVHATTKTTEKGGRRTITTQGTVSRVSMDSKERDKLRKLTVDVNKKLSEKRQKAKWSSIRWRAARTRFSMFVNQMIVKGWKPSTGLAGIKEINPAIYKRIMRDIM